jgi:hypothetical protein
MGCGSSQLPVVPIDRTACKLIQNFSLNFLENLQNVILGPPVVPPSDVGKTLPCKLKSQFTLQSTLVVLPHVDQSKRHAVAIVFQTDRRRKKKKTVKKKENSPFPAQTADAYMSSSSSLASNGQEQSYSPRPHLRSKRKYMAANA